MNYKKIIKIIFLVLKMNVMEILPKEILDIIFNYVDLGDQLNLKLVSKLFGDLKIKDLYNISDEYINKLSDKILFLPMFSELEKLNASYNKKITDEGIKRFKRTLKVLGADGSSSKITNEGIKGINLHTLDASWNLKITNDGIKGMKLHTLNARSNPNITDEGIKGMNLHTLDTSHNLNITDKGIKGMGLHILDASSNPNITDDGIRGINLHTLDASWNPNITDNGIRGMKLHTLYANGNPNIIYEIENGEKIYK